MKITVNIKLDDATVKALDRIAAALEQIAENTKPEPPPAQEPTSIAVKAS